MTPGYESFFGLVERPFSLTPDPRYFFKSRTHGRAIETLIFGLRRRERYLLVTGDLGLGKTILCRTLVDQLRRRVPVSLVANPLLTAGGLFRLLLDDFAGSCTDEAQRAAVGDATPYKLHDVLVQCLADSFKSSGEGAVVVIDEAHTLPMILVEHLQSLSALEHNREKLLQLVLVGQQAPGEPGALGLRGLDERVSTKARLLPLGRDECAAYVMHRLVVAGSGAETTFSPRAIDMLYGLSGGVPRLINLLCERALQEAAIQESHKVEPAMINAASSSLELLRTRPRRFRWFTRRVSNSLEHAPPDGGAPNESPRATTPANERPPTLLRAP
jgi:general secretion pathway protein A